MWPRDWSSDVCSSDLECEPDVGSATQARLVDVHYPWDQEQDPGTTHHWSEIIVAPDDEHIAWTILRADMGAAAAIGRLQRTAQRYEIENPRLISTVDDFLPDRSEEHTSELQSRGHL